MDDHEPWSYSIPYIGKILTPIIDSNRLAYDQVNDWIPYQYESTPSMNRLNEASE